MLLPRSGAARAQRSLLRGQQEVLGVAALVEIDREEAVRRIAAACARVPRVAAAYLFGSTLGRCRPDSDIDVGVIRQPFAGETDHARFRAGLALEGELMAALGTLDGHPFEVTVLDEAQPLFAMTVLRDGRLSFVGDRGAYTDFLEHVAQAYRQNAPRHRVAQAEIRMARATGRAR